MLAVCDENVDHVSAVLRVLSLTDDATDWFGMLAAEAVVWQPFIDRGLSVDYWLDMIAEALV